MKMRFLPDKPIDTWIQDQFKFGKFVDQIRSAIEQTDPPFVFGVLGDWGTGKTSVLNLLRDSLNTKPGGTLHLVPIWFNAWLYENEANIVYPLLYAIKKDYEERLKTYDTARKLNAGFLKVVAASTFALTDMGLRVVSKHFIGDTIKLADIQGQIKEVLERPDSLEKVLHDWADQVASLNEAYQSLVDSYAIELASTLKGVSKDDIRFVILVDDLDRCLPHTTVTILEKIKNFLCAERCIYILGLNPKVVYQGIRTKYQGLDIDGREYLEKILNYSFYVPEPESGNLRAFATRSLAELLPEIERASYQDHFAVFGQVLEECRFNNPRKIKRIFNHYLLFLDMYETDLFKYNLNNVVKLIILAEYFPLLFAAFQNDDARRELSTLGGVGLSVEAFEKKYGIPLGNSYQQLKMMQKLLTMQETSPKENRFSIHYQAVSSLFA